MEENHLVNLLAGVTLICDDDRPRLGYYNPGRYDCGSQTRTDRPRFDRNLHLGSLCFSWLASLASLRGCSHCLPEGLMYAHVSRIEGPPH